MQCVGNIAMPDEPLHIKPFGPETIDNRVDNFGVRTIKLFFTAFMTLEILFDCRKRKRRPLDNMCNQ
jgi:hypothetical protein